VSLSFVIFTHNLQSCAKSSEVDSKFLQTSSTYARNRIEFNTLSCGTPDVTLSSSDNCPPLCERRNGNFLTHTTTIESNSEAANFISSRSYGTKLKALFFKKKKSLSCLSWLPNPGNQLCPDKIWLLGLRTNIQVQIPLWPSYNQSSVTQTYLSYPAMTWSFSLQTTEVKLAGVYLVPTDLSSPLVNRNLCGCFPVIWNSGVVKCCFQQPRKLWDHGFPQMVLEFRQKLRPSTLICFSLSLLVAS
jgi:hypothetical protein